jgi:transcriptional regulator with XRE-family HTH domain
MHDHVGERIAWFRRILGMAQDELGKRVNRSRAQISNIEAGRHGIPVSQLKVYASALGVPPHALVP